MRDLQHRDKAAHLYESTPGLWVLSSVFAPGCAVANAFCHHPNPDRKVSQMVSGSRFPEMEPEKPPTRETAGAPLGPHQWHFYTPPKKVELSPDGQFAPGTRNSRGGLALGIDQHHGQRSFRSHAEWQAGSPEEAAADGRGGPPASAAAGRDLPKTQSQQDARDRWGTQVCAPALPPPSLSSWRSLRASRLDLCCAVLWQFTRRYLGREDELLAHLEQKYGPLSTELQKTFSKVAAAENELRTKGTTQQQPRRLEPLNLAGDGAGTVDRTVQQQQQPPPPPQQQQQQQQQQGLPIEKKEPAAEDEDARKAASGREPEPESEMALRYQTARREAVEQDHTVLTAVTSVRSPGEGGGGGGAGPAVDSTHGGSGMPPVEEAGSLTGGGAAIVSSETHARLREHTGGTEGTTAAGVNDDPSTQRGEPAFEEAITSGGYTRPELELCAPLQLHVASEAAALALIDAGATCISMLQPPRSYRVMSEGLFETVVPAIRTTLGQGADGRQHPDVVRLLIDTPPHLLLHPPPVRFFSGSFPFWTRPIMIVVYTMHRMPVLYAFVLTPGCCGLCSCVLLHLLMAGAALCMHR
eukprot:COSAG06_NODE_7486_length_2489_cov_1.864017_3_plen_582_part_00